MNKILNVLLILLITSVANAQTSDGNFNYNFLVGSELSQEDNKFSKFSPYLEFNGDTTWDQKHHTFIDLKFSSVPDETTDSNNQSVIVSEKAMFGEIGLESRWIQTQRTPEYTLFAGPVLKTGIATITEETTRDNVNHFVAAGIRIGESHKTWGLRRHFDIMYGTYEYFGNERLEIAGTLKIGESIPFFISTRVLLGAGKDDIRFMFGFEIDPQQIVDTFSKGLVKNDNNNP